MSSRESAGQAARAGMRRGAASGTMRPGTIPATWRRRRCRLASVSSSDTRLAGACEIPSGVWSQATAHLCCRTPPAQWPGRRRQDTHTSPRLCRPACGRAQRRGFDRGATPFSWAGGGWRDRPPHGRCRGTETPAGSGAERRRSTGASMARRKNNVSSARQRSALSFPQNDLEATCQVRQFRDATGRQREGASRGAMKQRCTA